MMPEIEDYMGWINFRSIKTKASSVLKDRKKKTVTFIVPQSEVPEYLQSGVFDKYTLNSDGLLFDHSEESYECQQGRAEIETAEFSKDNWYLIIHLIK